MNRYQYQGTPWAAVIGDIVGPHKCRHCNYVIRHGQHTICGPCVQRLRALAQADERETE